MNDDPQQAKMWNLKAVQAAQAGRHDIAAELTARAIADHPTMPEYHRNLAAILGKLGQHDQALAACNRAIELNPRSAQTHFIRGTILKAAGRIDETIASYRHAIELDPAFGPAWNNLGSTLCSAQRYDQAVEVLREAARLRPHNPAPYNNLGLALTNAGRLDEAKAAFNESIRLGPAPQTFLNLGNVFEKEDRFADAEAVIRQALAMQPNFAMAHVNLGNVLNNSGRHEEGRGAYEKATQLDPNNAEAHFNFAMSLLLHEDFERGWPEYEWRLRCKSKFVTRVPLPRWDGEELNGRTILIHSEQGLGDMIQFSRYLPMVAARGGRVIFECRPELHGLFAQLPGVERLVTRPNIPPFQTHCPLLSLPAAFRTRMETIPLQIPPLQAGASLSAQWASRLQELESTRKATSVGSASADADAPNSAAPASAEADPTRRLRIGLVWAGSPEHVNDRRRSMSVEKLAPLAAVRHDVVFISLQKRYKSVAEVVPPALRLVDWTSELKDFSDTAALIENLDLVIAVDTAVAHLAGAMGKPVWLLLPLMPDWRWLLNRSDSPWYPTMRLFRQQSAGDWDGVVRQVVEALRSFEAA